MSECIPSAPNIKGATQYTHLFLCISSGRRLANFSMRSLFFQIQLHPSLCPLISHSVWCHRPDVHFNAAFYVELSKLEPLTINDLSISFDLYSRQLQSSSLLGIAKLPLNQKETLQKGKKPITYFYHQDPVDLIDPITPTPVGNIFVTIALGYEEQLNLIEPQTRFIQVQITPMDKKNTKYSSPSLWMKTAHKHGWMSVEEIEENWMEIAQSNGWIPLQKNENLTLETFQPINILKEYEAQPTADLLTIQPNSETNPLFQEPKIINHELFPPEELVQIYPQPKIEFKNKIKKPITVMDFFPRLSYSNKYDNSEKSDSEWDILIGKYLKASSSTLKSFPKQKRIKSASFSKPPFLQASFNHFQNSNKKKIDRNSAALSIERSSSQSLDTNKSTNSVSQSESSELDSSNNFLMMLNNDQNKNDQNKFKNSKKFKKKYSLDDDEKEWSSDFFSDSPDAAASNQLELDLDKDKQTKNKKFNISLEEIVEKEMEKLSKNSKKSSQKVNDKNESNIIESNEDIQNNINNQDFQKMENENSKPIKNKPVFFSPPPSLTQVIQKVDKKVDDNINIHEEEINDNNNIDIENIDNNNNEEIFSNQNIQNYSNVDNHQIRQQPKKIRKRKHRVSNIQQTTVSNQENDQFQEFQDNDRYQLFENNSKSENISNFQEKSNTTKRKPKSLSPSRRPKSFKIENQDVLKTNSSFDTNADNYDQINYDNSREFASPNLSQTAPIHIDSEVIESRKPIHKDIKNHFASPPINPAQSNKPEAIFSAPSHRRRHNEDEPIRPYQPVFQDEIEQFNENYQKVETDHLGSQKSSIKKKKVDQYREQRPHKKRRHQDRDNDTNHDISNENPQNYENFSNSTFSETQKSLLRIPQAEEDEEDQPTSPKIQFDQEPSHDAPLSAPRHRHRRSRRNEDDEIQFKIYDDDKNRNRKPFDGYPAEEDNERQDDQLVEQSHPTRKRRQHRNTKDDELSIQKVEELNQLFTNNEQAASSSAPSSTSPSQSPQGQQITVSSSSPSHNEHHTDRRQKVADKIEYQKPPFSSEKVDYHTKSNQASPELQSSHKQTNSSSSADASSSKKTRKHILQTAGDLLNGRELTIAEKFSPDKVKSTNGSRSFIQASQSMADAKGVVSSTKKKISRTSTKSFYGVDNSSLMNKTLPVAPYRPSASFIESLQNESSLKKRKKRHNLTHSNSPKPPPKEESFLGQDDIIENYNNTQINRSFAVHSPTNKSSAAAKMEGEFSPQLIDFSSTSPTSSLTRFTHKKSNQNTMMKNVNDNQNLNFNEMSIDDGDMELSFKKSKNLPKKSSDIQGSGENFTVEVKHRKSGGSKKSPTKREKRIPKKPMDIKTAASFGPGPLSPATPNAQKKGIRMSPSLERMINGIDKLENSFDMSGIESDSED